MTTPSTLPSPPGPPQEQAAPRSRYAMGTLPNMLRSLLVVGLFVLALYAIVPRTNSVPRPAVDATDKARQVAAQTSWPVELPQGLGSGWVPTVATYGPGTDKVPTFTTVWKTPGGADIALKQSAKATNAWIARSVNDGDATGTVEVAGRTAERYRASDVGQVGYVLAGSGDTSLTIIAAGTASEDELRTFVASLRPVAPAPTPTP
jgi:hypothetical protein